MSKATDKIHVYLWSGTNKKGNKVDGEFSAVSPIAVQAELKRQGITASKIRKKPKPLFTIHEAKPNSADIVLFSRHVATMLTAGLPLLQTLDSLSRSHEKVGMQKLISQLRQDVNDGKTFSEALKKHPKHFGPLFCNLVAAGEESGTLDTMLTRIANYLEKGESLKRKIKKAMYYPISIIVVAFGVSCILLLFVVPQFNSLFESYGAQLPAFTRMILNLSYILQDYWWVVIVAVASTIFLFKRFRSKSKKFHYKVDQLLLKIAIFGPLLSKAYCARFTRTTSTLLSSGIPIVDALNAAARVTGNDVYARGINQVREDVATGVQLNLALSSTKLFSNMVIQMVSVGEESGSTDEMLGKVADYYEEEVDNAVNNLSTLMEPIIMVLLGTIVGGFVIAMYLPIFKLGSIF